VAPEIATLGEWLSLAMLIAATIEYLEIVRRRELRRANARFRDVLAVEGLRAMVRVLGTD
jgi:hypothetical protein